MQPQNRLPHDTLFTALRPLFRLDARRLTVLCALIVTVIERRTSVLSVLAASVALTGTTDSRNKRLKRFMQFELPPDLVCRLVFSLLPPGKVWLILDRTNWKLGKASVNVLLLSASWHSLSLPLVWTVLDREGNSNTTQRIELLERFLSTHRAFSSSHPLGGVLGDREFIGAPWFRFLRRSKLKVCIRLRATDRAGDQEVWRRFVHLKTGQAWSWGSRLRVHGVALFVVATITPSGERLFLACEHTNARRALEEYARRWGCECLHEALKTRGFDLEASHLTRPERVSTLLGVLALTFVWCCLTGERRHEERPIKTLKHGRAAKSLFRLGLDVLCDAVRPVFALDLAPFVALLVPKTRNAAPDGALLT